MDSLIQDVRYALRQLTRTPGLTLVAILSLALGIGANTALYQIADRVLFHPLAAPIVSAERLVSVVDGAAESGRWYENSYREYTIYRDQGDAFSGLAASSMQGAGLSSGEVSRPVGVAIVTRNFFDVLGVRPVLGSAFAGRDEPAGSDDAQIVLSHALWQQSFGGDGSVIGRTVRLNGTPFVVIGVAPAGFNGIDLGRTDVWMPLHAFPLIAIGRDVRESRLTSSDDNTRWLRVTGRLAPGATLAQAQASIVTARSRIPYTREALGADGRMETAVVSTTHTVALLGSDMGRFVLLLVGVVAFTLLIACANLATLLLARGAARSQELAVRIALGAKRSRLMRQLLTESLVLSLAGGAAGVLVAAWTSDMLRSFRATGIDLGAVTPDLGLSTVMAAFALAVVTSVLIGLAPAVAVTARHPGAALGIRLPTESSGQSRTRAWLIGAQIALAFVLLTGATLFGKSLRNALALDLGFQPDGLGVVAVNLGRQRYDTVKAHVFYDQLFARMAATRGVERVAIGRNVPVHAAGSRSTVRVERPGGAPENVGEHSYTVVTPGYFATLGIALARGRDFTPADDGRASHVLIINEALAERAWPGEDPIGKRVLFNGQRSEVIGVTRNAKYRSLRERGIPYFYLPLAQQFADEALGTLRLVFRAGSNTDRAIADARSVIRSLDPDLPILVADRVTAQLGDALLPQRMGTTVLGLLSAIGLVLALTGLYGVVAFAVARRTREIGVRIALGARSRDVLRLMVGQGLRPVLAGAVCGVAIVIAGGKIASGFLYGLAPTDPGTLLLAFAVLLATSVAAMLAPAVRATRIEPSRALRDE